MSLPPEASNRQLKPALVAAQSTTKWAGFFGVVGCLLRSRTIIAVIMDMGKIDKTCPYTSLIAFAAGASGLFAKLSAPEPFRADGGFWRSIVMKFLVTGGAGFIASHIVDRLINEGNQVVIVDDLSTAREDNLNAEAKFYRMDIRNPELASIFETEKPDYVSHHAAQASVIKALREPALDAQLNIQGSLNVIHLSHKHAVKKIVYASTGGALYGEPEYLPVDENHPVNPLTPYGVSKHTVEHYLYLYGVNYGLNYTVVRYANVYGPRQNPHGEAGVIAIFAQKMLDGERPIIFGDGTATRDYVYIDDIVEANMLALDRGEGGIYNIGSNTETSVNEIFDLLKAESDFRLEPIRKPKRVGEVQRIFLTNDKAKAELGWTPKVELEEGIKRTVRYYRGD